MIRIDDEQKMIFIWTKNSDDKKINKYKNLSKYKNYKICTFVSGEEDIKNNIRGLIINHINQTNPISYLK